MSTQVEVVRSAREFDALRAEWDALAARHRHPLLSHDWFRACVPALHAEHDLRIVVVRSRGELVGAAPLAVRRERGIERLEFLGMRVLHEPSGFLYRDEAALGQVLEAVLALHLPVVLQRLDAAGPVERLLRGVARAAAGWVVSRETGPTAWVPIERDWQAFVAALSGKMRWQQKRARGLAEAQGQTTIEKRSPRQAEVDGLFQTFAELEAAGWKGERRSALLTKDALGDFFRDYARRAAARGTLRVWLLHVGGTIAAAQLTLEDASAVWVLKIAYDERLARMSPGFQLTFAALGDAFAQGFSAYEFLGSADEWKLRWRVRLRARRLLLVYPRSLHGVLALGADAGVHGARSVARRLSPQPVGSSGTGHASGRVDGRPAAPIGTEQATTAPTRALPASMLSKRGLGALAGIVAIGALLTSENLGARLLNELFLRVPGIDKVGHTIQYALVFLAVWWLCRGLTARRGARAALAVVATMLLGMVDEFTQRSIAFRSFELADLVADGCGAAAGLAIVEWRRPARRSALALAGAAAAVTALLAVQTYDLLKDYSEGVLYERTRQYGLAREHYLKALASGMETPNLFNALAWVEVESGVGDPGRAVEYGARALASRPSDADVLDTYGWALHYAGRDREALPFLLRAEAAKPRMYCIHLHLGEVYRALGQNDAARRHFEWQIRRLPGSPEAHRAELRLRALTTRPEETRAQGS